MQTALGELVGAASVADATKSVTAVVTAGTAVLDRLGVVEPPPTAGREAVPASVPAAVHRLALSLLATSIPSELAVAFIAAPAPGQAVAPPSPPPPGAPPVRPRLTAAQMWRKLELTDRQMTMLSGSLAVLSGLLTLYVTSPSWGAPGDYLKAFLWGSVLSEGIKFVTALVGRAGFSA
jgi:hypothetical protein